MTRFIGARRTAFRSAVAYVGGSYIFPAGTSTWTAPAGVTNIKQMYGAGGAGNGGYWYSGGFGGYMGAISSSNLGTNGTADWSSYYPLIYGDYTNSINAGTGPKTTGQHQIYVAIGTNDQIDPTGFNINGYYNPGYWTKGTPSFSAYASSGTITNAAAASGANIVCTPGFAFQYGYSGSSTTGFGQTFAGGTYSDDPSSGLDGTGYSASITTYTNVAVSPGTTYTINNYGSLVINW
jgi:hypothetical protein